MIRILAIALVSLRAAVRSRLVASLATVLVVTVVGLGLSIKGDGTLNGQVRVLLQYTLGLSALLLGAATLWTSCGGIAEEIKDKQIQLIAVKPVHRFQIWLGKWVGLVLLNALLLALTGITAYAVLHYRIRSSDARPEDRRLLDAEILTARRSILPQKENIGADIRERVASLVKEYGISDRISRQEIAAFAERQIRAERSTVPPSGTRQWVFDVPAGLRHTLSRPDTPCFVRIRLYSATRDREPVKGTWTVGSKDNPTAFAHAMQGGWEGVHQFSVPASALQAGRSAVVTFTNADGQQSHTMVLDPGQNIELLVRQGSFELNLVRALLILLCHLALVAALGLTAGTVFSFPVAAFMTLSILIVSVMGHYFANTSFEPDPHGDALEPSLYYVTVQKIMERLDVVIRPAMQLDPLEPLSDGVLVSWGFTGQALLMLFLLYPAMLFLIGSYCLKRRELALPE